MVPLLHPYRQRCHIHPRRQSHGQKKGGFTLLEVLIAIAILAFMVPALLLLMTHQSNNAVTLRDRTIAHWIAENKATELRLERTFLQRLLQRESTETVTMANSEWTIAIDIEKTAIDALILYRIKVTRDGGETPITTLETYLNET